MRWLVFCTAFFLTVTIVSALKDEWIVWIIALFATFYFANKLKKD